MTNTITVGNMVVENVTDDCLVRILTNFVSFEGKTPKEKEVENNRRREKKLLKEAITETAVELATTRQTSSKSLVETYLQVPDKIVGAVNN